LAAVREQVAQSGGVGHLVYAELARSVVDSILADAAMVDAAMFNDGLVGAICEEAEYRPAVADEEFSEPPALPEAWRAYLQGRSWFSRGWLPSGDYLWLYSPREGAEILDAWDDGRGRGHPEELLDAAMIGGNGSREHLLLDMRRDPPAVISSDLMQGGLWSGMTVQASDVGSFIEAVESGRFTLQFPH
jgi:hypothetical protein